MNLFVSGTKELELWARKLVDLTRPQLVGPPLGLQLEVTSDLSLADCIVTQDPSESTIDPCSESERRVPRVLVVHPENCPDGPLSGNDLILIRGVGESLQFAQIAAFISQQARLSHLSKMICGPIYHDVRGALSVLALSRQLIDSGADGKLVSPKLGRAGDKIASALGYLQHRAGCATREFPPEESTTRGLDSLHEIQRAFSANHAERTLDLQSSTHDAIQRAPDWFVFALGGVIDGCARLSTGSISVEAVPGDEEANGPGFIVLGSEPALSANQALALPRPSGLGVSDLAHIPYRLATASSMIFDAGGKLTFALADKTLTFGVQLPSLSPRQ